MGVSKFINVLSAVIGCGRVKKGERKMKLEEETVGEYYLGN